MKRTIMAELSKPSAYPMKRTLAAGGFYRRSQYAEEVFADVYAAKYYKGFTSSHGNMSRREVLGAFPNTVKAMDSMNVRGQHSRILDRAVRRGMHRLDVLSDAGVPSAGLPFFGGAIGASSLETWLTRGRR